MIFSGLARYSALPVGSAFGQTLGNTLEVIVAAYLIRRLVRSGRPLDSVAGVRELAAFAVSRGGVDEMWLGVVPAAGFDEAALQAAYLRAFPRCPRPTIMRVDKIPRNEMGKVLRKELRERAESGAVN